MKIIQAVLLSLFVFLLGCGQPETYDPPLLETLKGYERNVTTNSRIAKDYFDQGMVLYYAFNHEAAIESFRRAQALDSTFGMAYWGEAASFGPNINNSYMDSSARISAWNALQKALAVKHYASALEQDLIDALAVRYTWPAPEDRRSLDSAYARAMKGVWQKYPKDVDVGALYAESLMDLRPWDLWTPDGKPMPETPEIMATLENVMTMMPDHPGATHFYIHTVEASTTPELALKAADALLTKIPGAGHLVHMPSHIYIRTGDYDKAIRSNELGILADTTFAPKGGFYSIYRAHNYHFLAYAAMFDGQKEKAMTAARNLVDQVPIELVRQFPDFLDAFHAVPTHVMVRFGMWDELLNEPKPAEDLFVTVATWHYGRVIALTSTGKIAEAGKEFTAFRKAFAQIPQTRTVGNNSARTVLEIGLAMAEGELEFRRGKRARAFQLLRKAVEMDDALRYDEPWGWMMPVRHSLGALLVEAKMIKEAEEVYRKDLSLHANNGWALKGLSSCLHASGQHEEAEKVDAQFRTSWARSDIVLRTSCFCSPGVG